MSRTDRWVKPLLWLAAASCIATVSLRAGAPQARSTSQSVPTTAERVAEMRHHFSQVAAIYEGVIRGDLAAVRAPANVLAVIETPDGFPVSSRPFVAAVREAARILVTTSTLTTAASATASLVAQCGECHRAVGIRPVPSTPAKPDVGGLVGHMLDHQLAVDELMQGLLTPSDTQWILGARRLRESPFRTSDLPADSRLTEKATTVEAQVRQAATVAETAASTNGRSTAFARVLATCSACHGLHREIWGPKNGS